MHDDPLAAPEEQFEHALEAIAPFYDLDFGPIRADIGMYRELASAWAPARVLELGAGPGRVAIPLAEDGHQVTAVDASAAMLRRGCAPMRAAGVELLHADMRALPEQLGVFDLIICALGTFQHLLRRADQTAALRGAARLLAPGGRLALDLTAPRPEDLEPGAQPLRFEWVREDPCLGTVTKLAGQELAEPRGAPHPPDGAAPIAWLTYVYESTARRAAARFPLRVAITPGELEGLLRESGLQPNRWYGSWELEPLGRGERTIVLSSAAPRS